MDATVPELLAGLELEVDGARHEFELIERDLEFAPGAGGLPTLRLELDLKAAIAVGDGTSLRYRVGNYADRLGWRDVIAVAGEGTRIDTSSVGSEDPTNGLRSYPEDSLEDPPDIRSADITVSASSDLQPEPSSSPAAPAIGVPLNVDPLLSLFDGAQTPLTALLAIVVSTGLGAVHAASPGHGKTLVAAYLVGSQGELRQAIWLALTVAVTHTAGVFILGLITLTAGEFLVPETVVAWLAVASGVIVIILGGSLLRNARRGRPPAEAHDHGHAHPHGHSHAHGHDHAEDGAHDHGVPFQARSPRPLTRRSAIALGLAGGLVPSASALIVFLLALTVGRLAFGIVLIVAFGVGMALVLGGVGFAVVVARRAQLRATHRWSRNPLVGRVTAALPLLSGLAVLATGIVVTVQAAARLT
jgi:nickel/cobalt transporter (NicO) family protein